MASRTYHQFCPVAYSLDLIGERWTLLLLRELMFGPRRFTDIHRALPGLGKNLLSQRLKDLEASGVIARRRLPPPAPATVYELTVIAEGLKTVLDDLTRWGLRFMLAAPVEQDHLGVIATLNALRVLFDPPAAVGVRLGATFHLQDEVVHAHVQDGDLTLGHGPAPAQDLEARTDPKTLLFVLIGGLDAAEAIEKGRLHLEKGDTTQLAAMAGLFRLPDKEK